MAELSAARTSEPLDAVVIGRIGVDLYPNEIETPLSEVRTFTRFVGGFAGNVATGLARLGVRAAVLSRVGKEGHGEFVRRFLEEEGVSTAMLGTDPEWPTPPTFCEIWPPEHFPITYYRHPTAPDWQTSHDDADFGAIAAAPLLYASATCLAQSPSRELTLEALERHPATTIFDLDHRPALWADPEDYRRLAQEAIAHATIVVGNQDELEASVGSRQALLEAHDVAVVEKRGSNGALVATRGETTETDPHPVEVVNGLGAGDAFAAAMGWRLLEGDDLPEAVRWANVAGALVAAEHSCSEAMPTAGAIEQALNERTPTA